MRAIRVYQGIAPARLRAAVEAVAKQFRNPASSRLKAISFLGMTTLTVLPMVVCPAAAFAATWPVSSSRLSPSLGFHQTYKASGESFLHSGIDIVAQAGSPVESPVAGTVSFVGNVPTGDSSLHGGGEGETMLAVSIKIADGRTLTLLPLQGVSAEVGDEVSEGATMGTLAASGDRSSASAHLHMGLKQGGTYYDPMTLFGTSAITATAAQPQQAATHATPQASTAAPALSQVAEPTAEPVEDAAASDEFGTIYSADVQWAPEEESTGAFGPVMALASQLGQACLLQAQGLVSGLEVLAFKTGVPLLALSLAIAIALLSLVAFIIFLAVRVIIPRARTFFTGKKLVLVRAWR